MPALSGVTETIQTSEATNTLGTIKAKLRNKRKFVYK
jgi:hypothetical protein